MPSEKAGVPLMPERSGRAGKARLIFFCENGQKKAIFS